MAINLDLSEIDEKAAEIQEAEQNEVVCENCDDEMSTGHKVVFGIVMGILVLSGIGIPVMIWLLIKSHNKQKQLQKQLEEFKNQKEEPVVVEATEEKSEEVKEEPKTEEKAPKKK